MVPITTFFGGILALMSIPLSLFVVKNRRANRISLDHQGNEDLLRAMRMFGNFIEYSPFFLLLLLLLELMDTWPLLLTLLGAAFIIGRLLHAYAIWNGRFRHRKYGMYCTYIPLLICGLVALWKSFFY